MACVTSLGIPENVSLPLHPCSRYDDTDKCKVVTLKGAYRTGYAVLGATAVTTLALVLL
jgi:hypothetical protein